MNELISFTSPKYGQIRTVTREGEPWFVAKDVCNALEIKNSRDALNRLDDDEKYGVGLTDSIGRPQTVIAVNEPGLYSLVLGSRKPEAKNFKRWITHEVIPAIRKTGAYLVNEAPTTNDCLSSASLLAHCPAERLEAVVTVLQAGGWNIPREVLQAPVRGSLPPVTGGKRYVYRERGKSVYWDENKGKYVFKGFTNVGQILKTGVSIGLTPEELGEVANLPTETVNMFLGIK